MALPSVRRSVLVDDVIQRLRDEITSGRWPMGARIPTETALIAELGIARGTLREATRALIHAGLLQARQGDGTYVRATSELSGAIQRLDSELGEVLEVRQGLDAQAMRPGRRPYHPRSTGPARRTAGPARHGLAAARPGRVDPGRSRLPPGCRHRRGQQPAERPLRRPRPGPAPLHGSPLGRSRLRRRGPRGHEDLLDALRAGDAVRAARSATSNIDATGDWHGTSSPSRPGPG